MYSKYISSKTKKKLEFITGKKEKTAVIWTETLHYQVKQGRIFKLPFTVFRYLVN